MEARKFNIPRRCEYEKSISFEFAKNFLVSDRIVGSRGFFAPLWYKNGDFSVPPIPEPINAYLDSSAREYLLVPMAHRYVATVYNDRAKNGGLIRIVDR